MIENELRGKLNNVEIISFHLHVVKFYVLYHQIILRKIVHMVENK